MAGRVPFSSKPVSWKRLAEKGRTRGSNPCVLSFIFSKHLKCSHEKATEMSEFDFKQILQRNYQQLTQELEVDKVVRRLFTRDVLDEEDKEDIEAERSRHERAEKLLGMLLRRGEGNFKVFCEILGKLPSQQHLANILASHINSGKIGDSSLKSLLNTVDLAVLELYSFNCGSHINSGNSRVQSDFCHLW